MKEQDKPNLPVQTQPALLDVLDTARLLSCSPRHVYRMADAGKIPPPVRIGKLVRWDLNLLTRWLADGCKPVRR